MGVMCASFGQLQFVDERTGVVRGVLALGSRSIFLPQVKKVKTKKFLGIDHVRRSHYSFPFLLMFISQVSGGKSRGRQSEQNEIFLQVNAMLNFLEACHFKISCAVCHLEGRVEPHSKFKQYIERNKDKTVRLQMQIKQGFWAPLLQLAEQPL